MKQVTYFKNELTGKRGRTISIREHSSDVETDTSLTKRFIYLVKCVDTCPEKASAPEIRILKRIDTEQQRERFLFKVKGVVYIKKNRFIYELRYCHSLNIKMFWKTHVLSSDNPVTLG
ncbi:MAG: hypothetical protein HQL17_08560 [Candidatus Omnitrophica bacterium]|nr:hypothetical protein [Candidatus Omnitrophota bacterium]